MSATVRTLSMLGLSLAAASFADAASAAVVEVTETGFRSASSFEVAAPVDKVWAALVTPGRWWNPQHSWFGNPQRDFVLESRAGGCFCETSPEGAAAQHMRVVFVRPNAQLTLSGALGPLATEGVAGGLVVKLDKAGETATRVTVTYTVGGYVSGGMAKWAPLVDGVIAEQFGRLERFAETGRAD